MPEIFSWIDDAARSGRAVDYQDHYAAVTRLRMEQDEARECIKAALDMMEGCERCGLSSTGSGEDPLISRLRKAAGLDSPTNRNIEKGGA